MLHQPVIINESSYVALLTTNRSYPIAHRHIEFEILYILEGEVELLINDNRFIAKKGDLVLIESLAVHKVLKSEHANKFLLLEFGPTFLGNSFNILANAEFNSPVFNVNDNSISSAIKALLDEIIEEVTNCTIESKLIIQGNIYKIAAHLHRMRKDGNKLSQKQEAEIKLQMVVGKALELVNFRYKDALTVEDAARETGYSVSNFCRIFKKAFGTTFHSFLNDVRVKNACVLLSDATLPIYAIAQKVGYPDTKTFCRIFKEKKGLTPTEYRQNSKPEKNISYKKESKI